MDVAAVPDELAGPVFVVLFVVGFLMAAGLLVLVMAAVAAPFDRRRKERTLTTRQTAKADRQRWALEQLGAAAEGPADQRAEQLVLRGASMLGVSGGWQNRAAARKVYDELQAIPPAVSEPALLRALVRRPGNRQIVFLAVRLGRPAPDRLLQALNATQELEIALHFLNTEVPDLIEPARDWCRLRGYAIESKERFGGRSLAWGQF